MNKALELLEQFEREFNAMPQEVFDAMGTDLRERWLALIVNANRQFWALSETRSESDNSTIS